ncbi:MAG: tyrosine-type recombinase/integrase, partial [Candidatus Methylarchaceae archaeon HK02M1]|nr:tyrosine-type recombinase/integrase [Candidatus Methylarchaceae archaeon HK02M1]
DWLRKRQKRQAPKGLYVFYSAVRSYMNYKKAPFELELKIKGRTQTPTIEDERIPSPEELRKILHHADIRAKVCMSLIAFAGLRFESISSLTLADLVDLDIEALTPKEMPMMIWVPDKFSKIRQSYRTFLIQEGVEYLIEYLKERKSLGEKLTPKSQMITSDPARWRERRIKSDTISRYVRTAMRRAGFKERPYVLRSYFDFALVSARVQPTFQQYFMGHRGSIENVYTTKKHLPPQLMEPLREAFRPAEQYLTTLPRADELEQRKRAGLDALKIIEAIIPDHPAIEQVKKSLVQLKV